MRLPPIPIVTRPQIRVAPPDQLSLTSVNVAFAAGGNRRRDVAVLFDVEDAITLGTDEIDHARGVGAFVFLGSSVKLQIKLRLP